MPPRSPAKPAISGRSCCSRAPTCGCSRGSSRPHARPARQLQGLVAFARCAVHPAVGAAGAVFLVGEQLAVPAAGQRADFRQRHASGREDRSDRRRSNIAQANLTDALNKASSEVRAARESVASGERALAKAQSAADQAQQVVNIVNVSFRAGGGDEYRSDRRGAQRARRRHRGGDRGGYPAPRPPRSPAGAGQVPIDTAHHEATKQHARRTKITKTGVRFLTQNEMPSCIFVAFVSSW